MNSLPTISDHLPPNDRLILLIREVQNTHKSQLEVKRILKLVKKEKQNIIFELKKYEQIFNTYNELQNKLNQLLNKFQQLSKHKINLFKNIHQIANQLKPNNNNININNNNINNNESDKELTPLCLKEEDLIDIQLKQLVCKAIPQELEFVPNLPLINRFDKNSNYSKKNLINNNKSFDDLKKINFVYNSTLHSNNNNNNNEKLDELSKNSFVSNTFVEQIINPVKYLSDETINKYKANGITFCSPKKSLNIKTQNDINVKEENNIESNEDQNLTLNKTQIHRIDINIINISDQNILNNKVEEKFVQINHKKTVEPKVQTINSSHISKLRKNLNQSEDQHLFKELSLKEYSKHTNHSNQVIKSVIKKRHHKNSSRISPKKMQSIITTVSKNHSKNRDRNEN
jgi:hypothetical protein